MKTDEEDVWSLSSSPFRISVYSRQCFFQDNTAKTVFLPVAWPMTDTIELPTRVQVVFSVEIGYCIGGWIIFTLDFLVDLAKKNSHLD